MWCHILYERYKLIDYFINKNKILVIKQFDDIQDNNDIKYDLLEIDRFIIRSESYFDSIELVNCDKNIIDYISLLNYNWKVRSYAYCH